jgi:hypothetical protein
MTQEAATVLNAWAPAATAFFTALLSIGVFFAAGAYRAQLREARIVETGALLEQWREDSVRTLRAFIDETDDHDENRARTLRFYKHVHALRRRPRKLRAILGDSIQATRALAERTEIYLRKGVADEAIIVEHLGYAILASYYHLQEVLQLRAQQQNLDYEGWRSLALRVQDYAKLHPKDTNLEDILVWAELPPLHYKDGSISDRHEPGFWRSLKLRALKPPTKSFA